MQKTAAPAGCTVLLGSSLVINGTWGFSRVGGGGCFLATGKAGSCLYWQLGSLRVVAFEWRTTARADGGVLRVARYRGWVGTASGAGAHRGVAASRRRASRRRYDEWGVATVSAVASRRRASRREAPRRARRDGEMGGHGRGAARGAAEHRGVTAASVAATSRRDGRRDGERGGVAAASVAEGSAAPAAARRCGEAAR